MTDRMRNRVSIIAFCLLFIALAPSLSRAGNSPATYAQVQAIFVQRCMSCHDAKEAEGDLVMETFATLMAGGEKGKDIIPGNADESRMIRQLERRAKPFMPPPKKARQLPPEEIATLRAWINSGAPGPKPGEIAIAPTTRPIAKVIPKVAVRRPLLALAYDAKKNIVAASRPGAVEIWSVEQQRIVRRLGKIAGVVNAVAFSADGAHLYAAGGDPGMKGRIWIWNTADWKLASTLEGHADAIYSLAISPDDKILATGSYDQKIGLWDIASSAPPRMLSGHNGAVFGVAFRNDGRVLASASADRTLKLWDVQSGARLDTRPESFKDLYGLAWKPDGQYVAAGGVDNRIRVWKISPTAMEGTNTLAQTKFAHDGTILRIAWSPDGNYILSGADNNTLRLFTADDMKQKTIFPEQSDWPTALTFAEGSKLAIVGRADGSISFYDVLSGREVKPPMPVAPTLTSLSLRGIQRGHTAIVQITGKNLALLSSVKIVEPAAKISAVLLPDSKLAEARIEITAAADAPLGAASLIVANAGGQSAPMKLWVDDLPQLQRETTAAWTSKPLAIQTPVSVWGTMMPAGNAHAYLLEARKGQTLVFDVAAQRFSSKSEISLSVLDAGGRVLASAGAAGDDIDPLLAFTAPADGQYLIRVSDLSGGGTIDHFYRLSIGDFAYVTGTFPLAIPAGCESRVQLLGHHLPPEAWVKVKAGAEGEAEVPLDAAHFRSRRAMKVLVSDHPELVHAGQDAGADHAMTVPVPGSMNGRIASPGEADLCLFDAKAGTTYAVETLAAQRGSPIDTKIQVLYPDGRPVQRLQLRAIRDSNITFRGFDANDGGARFPNYLEMDLNQYVYINGEVVRLFGYPQGPDSNFFFYMLNGKRRCYFDTTATAHAVEEKCFVVEPHPVGEKLTPNGLPVFPLYYENDDDADRALGADSRLLFTAPADGKYMVRVTDTRNFGGNDYVYRLTVRPAKPDFTASIVGYDANPPAGAGREFTVKLNRLDGFDGPVQVEISNPPAGFMVSSPLVVEAGQWEALGTIYAAPNAPMAMPAASAPGLKVTASATIDGQKVTRSLPDLKSPWAAARSQVLISLDPDSAESLASSSMPPTIVLTPGKLTPAWLRVQRNGYTKAMNFDARDLPHGVYIADIGLSGVQLLEGQTQRQIFIACAPWVVPTTRPAHLRIRDMGNPTTPPISVVVKRSGD